MTRTKTNPLVDYLALQPVLILDGGLASELARCGADIKHELWSAKILLDDPDLIAGVHLRYLEAGADIITSASYQATLQGLDRAGLGRADAMNLMRFSVALARQACDRFLEGQGLGNRLSPLVAASIGPYGASLHDGSEYTGAYDLNRRQLMEFHRPRLEALIESEPDIIAFETIPSLREAEALARLLEEYPNCSAWLSFSCKDDEHVSRGEEFSDCVSLADDCDAIVAVGVNCTHPRFLPALLTRVAGTPTPLIAYPNAGELWDPQTGDWVAGEPAALDPVSWVSAGARILGGCCRVGPEDISRIRAAVLPGIEGSHMEKPEPG